MQNKRMGATLFELLLAIILVCILLTVAMPTARSTMDGLAARAARESAFALFSRARAIALQDGGAEIELSALDDRITIRAPSGAIEHEVRFDGREIDLHLGGGSDPVILRYDAHGLGRMMSRTVTFTARQASAGITVSSFGRVRRW